MIRIAALAFRSLDISHQRWQPTADHLNRHLPQYRFELMPLRYDTLDRAIADERVDLVMTHPDHYIKLHAKMPVVVLATLMPVTQGEALAQFGGVIFTRADRDDINQLADLKGKSLIAPRRDALGVYIAQQWSLQHEAGMDIDETFAHQHFIGPPLENIVNSVLTGKADIGFVRTGVLENMADRGTLALADLKVINRKPTSTFPLLLSTDLYPEWPLLALPHVDKTLYQAVASELQSMTRQAPGQIDRIGYGFVPPMDYGSIESVMLNLNMHPRSRSLAIEALASSLLQIGLVVISLAGIAALVINRRIKRLNTALVSSNVKLKLHNLLLERLGDGVYCMDLDGNTKFANDAAQRMLGYSAEEFEGSNSHRLFHHSHRDGTPYPIEECPVYKTLEDGKSRKVDEWLIRKDGSHLPVSMSASAIDLDDGSSCVVVVMQDISERLRLIEEARLQRDLMQNVVDATPDLIFYKDTAGHYLGCNVAFAVFANTTPAEIVGKTDYDLFDRDTADFSRRKDQRTLTDRRVHKNEEWVTYGGGQRVLLETHTSPLLREDLSIAGVVGISRDITLRKQNEEEVTRMAFYDPLTRLPNRRLMIDRLQVAITGCRRQIHYGALLMIDLDHFKTVNDTEGHDGGDRVLINTGERLIDVLRASDTAARVGGDEFVVILTGLGQELKTAHGYAARVAKLLLHSLNKPHLIGTREYVTPPSVGIALFGPKPTDVNTVIKRADQAMYKAKHGGRNQYCFATSRQRRPEDAIEAAEP